ncbi:MAG: aminomethyl-transferring glycine dehydrogenase subunit GcvPB [Candidatus Bipolaricaulota bacterium]|nr:aminomethyl-transferring glycine dehydrogenase subunit GcvPB [Candidatus Bipolaricaulota bacterium]
MSTIFDRHVTVSDGCLLPKQDVPEQGLKKLIPSSLQRSSPPRIPQLSEPELARHYTRLSKLNYGIDDGLYPLGSCTMKYNPKVNEDLARLPGFALAHPKAEEGLVQGSLHLLYEVSHILSRMAGLDAVTLQPAAGAHGELTGMFLLRRYFEKRGEPQRKRILLPDSAHGTNPASANTAGFSVVQLPSNEKGMVDLAALKGELDSNLAGIMLTVPNTLGIFEEEILSVTELVHEAGGLCYFDGANLNAFLGRARPGDMGADVFHFNFHKTLSTPHGGGGPGAGPVAVSGKLSDLLPVPRIKKEGEKYRLDWDFPDSIGSMHPFYGNFGVLLKAYVYVLLLGDAGLRAVSENAVLNANYLQTRLKETFTLPYDRLCKHEFVLSGAEIGPGIKTLDIAKRLIDYGFHPPTIYFPLIVQEALMIEPTECEGRDTLDRFVEAMERIAAEAGETPEQLHTAPQRAPVHRLDETRAARQPVLTYPFDAER